MRWFVFRTQISRLIRDSKLGLGFLGRQYSDSSAGESRRFVALWGNGDYGRLGLGSLDSQWTPVVCRGFGRDGVRSVACGGAHTLFLTESGRVYASGLNDFGQLGISDEKNYIMEPVEVCGLPKEISQISAGYTHSCAITVDGELYVWGKNSSGQLGLGKSAPKVVARPTKVDCLTGTIVKMVSLGSEHSVAITDEGLALSWGGGGQGRLGHGHQSTILGFLKSSSEYTPRLIKKLEGIKVKSVAAGLLHSACIDENGSVFIFGERSMNKLGSIKPKSASMPLMETDVPISQDVACGGYHTCIITNGGELYTWGSNENGCLGIGSTDIAHQPQRVEGPFLRHSVSKVSCGWKHTAAIADGHIFTWGWGGSHGTFSVDGHSSGGQLGHGTDVDYNEPRMVQLGKLVKAVYISCGFNHTGAIFEYL
ncbi:hypothetical protein Droror1_Dr00001793 [Drosera rotundifolia]